MTTTHLLVGDAALRSPKQRRLRWPCPTICTSWRLAHKTPRSAWPRRARRRAGTRARGLLRPRDRRRRRGQGREGLGRPAALLGDARRHRARAPRQPARRARRQARPAARRGRRGVRHGSRSPTRRRRGGVRGARRRAGADGCRPGRQPDRGGLAEPVDGDSASRRAPGRPQRIGQVDAWSSPSARPIRARASALRRRRLLRPCPVQ